MLRSTHLSFHLSFLLLSALWSTATATSHAANYQKRLSHQIKSARPIEGDWTALQEGSVAECARLRERQEIDGPVVCYKRIYGQPETHKIVDQLIVLQSSADDAPIQFPTALQLFWDDGNQLLTSPFSLLPNHALSVVSRTLHFIHEISEKSISTPVISTLDKSPLIVFKTPSQTSTIPSNLSSFAHIGNTSVRKTRSTLRIWRRQESDSVLLLAPTASTTERGRQIVQATEMNSELAVVMTVPVSSAENTRGPRPRTSSIVSPVSDYSETPSPTSSPEQSTEYSLHTGRELSVEMVPYGLILVATLLGCGCLVVAFSAYSRRALRKEYREGQLLFAEKQGQF